MAGLPSSATSRRFRRLLVPVLAVAAAAGPLALLRPSGRERPSLPPVRPMADAWPAVTPSHQIGGGIYPSGFIPYLYLNQSTAAGIQLTPDGAWIGIGVRTGDQFTELRRESAAGYPGSTTFAVSGDDLLWWWTSPGTPARPARLRHQDRRHHHRGPRCR